MTAHLTSQTERMTTAPVRPSVSLRPLEIATMARRSWRLFFLLALPLPVIIGARSLLTAREYKAGASFMPQEPNTAQMGIGAIASQLGIPGANRAGASPQFYADLLVSRSLLRAVALTVYDVRGASPFHGTLLDYFDLKGSDHEKSVLDAIRLLDERVLVTTSRTTGVVSLEVRTKSRELSVAIVERLLALLNDFNLNRRRFSGRAEREFLDERVNAAEKSLVSEEERLASFLARNRSLTNAPELQAERSRIERRITLRQQALVGLSQALEAARTDEVRDTPVITIVERPEDSLEPVGRGTIVKTLLALFAGVAIALAVILLRGYRRAAAGTAAA